MNMSKQKLIVKALDTLSTGSGCIKTCKYVQSVSLRSRSTLAGGQPVSDGKSIETENERERARVQDAERVAAGPAMSRPQDPSRPANSLIEKAEVMLGLQSLQPHAG